ncbi:tetratricopeptide repeat protein [Candidatus Albibeggiatoa sp. nov. BB20]|uniref:glycosyltransferase family 2 protein n=1 Tax=Candidatus Albibeggiatoa sp. nov. BB20 TaxID=3162723 RepID=UPI0033654444
MQTSPLIQKAATLAKQGKVQAAITHYQKAIQASPNQPIQVYQALGELLIKNNQLEAAEQCFQFLIKNVPNYIEAHVYLAKIASQTKNLALALERWEYCIHTFPQKIDLLWFVNKADILLKLERFAESEKTFKLITKHAPQVPAGYIGLAFLSQTQGKWELALEYWDTCLQKFPQQIQASWLTNKIKMLMQLNLLDDAEKTCQILIKLDPNESPSYVNLARIAQLNNDRQTELKYWQICFNKFHQQAEIWWYVSYSNAYSHLGKLEDAEHIFSQTMQEYPKQPIGFIGFAKIAEKMMQYDIAVNRWKQAYQLFPDEIQIQRGYIFALSQATEYEQAEKLSLELYNKTQDVSFQIARCTNFDLQYQCDAALALVNQLVKAHPENMMVFLKKIDILTRYWEKDKLQQAIPLFESIQLEQLDPRKIDQVKLDMVRAYIYNNNQQQAAQLAKTLLSKTESDYLEIQSWYYQFIGDAEKAKQISMHYLAERYSLETHSKTNLQRIDSKPINLVDRELLLFAYTKDELQRLDWFLDYYRQLGVTRFFIVDNDSSDQTQAFLLQQADVHLFWTNDHYGRAGSGMSWINQLVEDYGDGHWCLFTDTDEAFVFPEMEHKGIHHLLDYLDANGYEAVKSFMLDMYPETFGKNNLTVRQAIDNACYFDNDYSFFGYYKAPYWRVRGGVRKRLFEGRELQNKTPLIKGGKGIKFLASSHFITAARVADVSSVLLHYKLPLYPQLLDADRNILQDKNIVNLGGHCQRRHHIYQQKLSEFGTDNSCICPSTEKYVSSQQLVDLGLIQKPKDF